MNNFKQTLDNKAIFESFLTKLGLTNEESLIFMTLMSKGQITILTLSRLTGINRTKIYRLVELLINKGLTNEIIDENKRYLKSVDLNKLELLVKQEEEKVKYLRDIFPQLGSFMPEISSLSHPTTKVVFYRGIEGVRQQGWNTLQAKGEIVGFTYRVYAEIVGQKFADLWAEEMTIRKLYFREILSDEYFKSNSSQSKFKGITKHKSPFFKTRYIPSKILKINHQMDIYNNVVSIYNWYEGEVFGIEIYNEKVATMQKQLFEIVWKVSKTL